MSETTCPVFYADERKLDDLCMYVQEIERDYPGIGVCKIVPPPGWYNRKYNLDSLHVPIDTPIKQYVTGQRGAYHLTSLEVKSTTVKDFHVKAMKDTNISTCPAETERNFWKLLGKGEPPMYGADIEGSLFCGEEHEATYAGRRGWTLNRSLSDMLRLLPSSIPGVNTTMLYVGMWRAMFAFHVEDLDLYSINYLHAGAPKSWYSIQPGRRLRFEALAEGHFASDLRECKEYLRHKTKLFSPTRMRESGLQFDTVVQRAGEFVVTFPGAYHAGFNHGFNLAEATNFATPRWLGLGSKARICKCRPHSVFIEMSELEGVYRRHLAMEEATIVIRKQKPGRATATSAGCSGSSGAGSDGEIDDALYWAPLQTPAVVVTEAASGKSGALVIDLTADNDDEEVDVGEVVKEVREEVQKQKRICSVLGTAKRRQPDKCSCMYGAIAGGGAADMCSACRVLGAWKAAPAPERVTEMLLGKRQVQPMQSAYWEDIGEFSAEEGIVGKEPALVTAHQQARKRARASGRKVATVKPFFKLYLQCFIRHVLCFLIGPGPG
jgi:jumonji domain-containing protein 2